MSQKEIEKAKKFLDKQKYLKAVSSYTAGAEKLLSELKVEEALNTFNESIKIMIERINSGDRTEKLYLLASETISALNSAKASKNIEINDELNSNVKSILENSFNLGKNFYFSVCQEIGPLLLDFYENNDTIEKANSIKKELAKLYFNEGKKLITIGKGKQKRSAADILIDAVKFMKIDEDYVSILANIEEVIKSLEKNEILNPIFDIVEVGLYVAQKNNVNDAYQRFMTKVKDIIEIYVDDAITNLKWRNISLTNEDMNHMMSSFTNYSENSINKDILLEQLNLINSICSRLTQNTDISILKEWGNYFNKTIIKRLDSQDKKYHLDKILSYYSFILNEADETVGSNLFENFAKSIYSQDEKNLVVPFIVKEQGKAFIKKEGYAKALNLFADSFHRYSALEQTSEAYELLQEMKDLAILAIEEESEKSLTSFIEVIVDSHSKLMSLSNSSAYELEKYSMIIQILQKVKEKENQAFNDGIINSLLDISNKFKDPFLLSRSLLYASEYMNISDSNLIAGLNPAVEGFLGEKDRDSAQNLALNVLNSLIKNSYKGTKEQAEKLSQIVGKIILNTENIEQEKLVVLLQKWGFKHEFNSPPYTTVFSFLNQTYNSFKSYVLLDSLLIGHCRGLLKGGFVKEMVDLISNHLSRWNATLALEALKEWYVPLLTISGQDQEYILDIIKILLPIIENTENFKEGIEIITKLNVHWAGELAKTNKMDQALERWNFSKKLALEVKDSNIIENILGSVFSTIYLAIEKSISVNNAEDE